MIGAVHREAPAGGGADRSEAVLLLQQSRRIGVAHALGAAMQGKQVLGLETIDSQFAVFDALPDTAQQRLLAAVAHEVVDARNDDADTLALWLKGDDLGMTREANSDFLADPVLHDALLTARDKAWTAQIDTMLRSGAHPFIAVGAAHVAGRDGLPEMLRGRGWTVTRVY